MFHMKQQDYFSLYRELLQKWQKAVNLVAPSTLSDIENRHFLDSAQLYQYIPKSAKTLVDMGSGAGFPALVLAILNQVNQGPLKNIYLIESDTKKCLFLKEVIRQLNLPVTVLNQRIESVQNIQADVITARALAPLSELLKLARPFVCNNTICLFLKGKTVDDEIDENKIPCQIEKIPSRVHAHGCILKITEVSND